VGVVAVHVAMAVRVHVAMAVRVGVVVALRMIVHDQNATGLSI